MAACVINIIVINTVKYFFELLAFISPIPTLDAIFELCTKALAGFFALVYAFNPWLSFMMNIILFLICLAVFAWSRRRIKYLRAILLDPIWTAMVKKIFNKTEYNPDQRIKAKLNMRVPNIKILIKTFPAKKLKSYKCKKKQLIYLAVTDEKTYIIKPHFFKEPKIIEMETNSLTPKIETGLLTNSLAYTLPDQKPKYKFLFSKVYNPQIEKIKKQFQTNI